MKIGKPALESADPCLRHAGTSFADYADLKRPGIGSNEPLDFSAAMISRRR